MSTGSYDGLYYSFVTGRIFEAETKNGEVLIKYADNLSPKSKKLGLGTFILQNEIGCYETIVDYFMEGL